MTDPTPAADVQSIVESARRLGVELDEADTLRWLAAIATQSEQDVTVDVHSGTFGHRIAMLDFSPRELARFRQVGEIVELTGDPAVTEGALALSGSAAQSKIQSYPGDADFFQRFNIKAATRDEACAILATSLKQKVLGRRRFSTAPSLESRCAPCAARSGSRVATPRSSPSAPSARGSTSN